MNRYLLAVFITLALSPCRAAGQVRYLVYANDSERVMFQHWDTTRTLNKDLIACLLLAEGASDRTLEASEWLGRLEREAKSLISSDASPRKKGKKLYEFLHDRLLRKFTSEATVVSLMDNGEFSCVTSTALYYHLANVVGLPVTFHATPVHVCPVIDDEGTKVWVEMTIPNDGFDARYDRDKMIEWLVENKLTTHQELAKKGEEAIYDEFIHGHYRTSPASILGYHYYNMSLKLIQRSKDEEAFWALAKARTLEEQDESVEALLDLSYSSLSSMKKVPASYCTASGFYFAARGRDTAAIVSALAGARRGVETLIEEQRDLSRADTIVQTLDEMVSLTPLTEEPLKELRQTYAVNKALEFYRKGKYEDAFRMISREMADDSANGRLQDLYADITIGYIGMLADKDQDDLAVRVADSACNRLPGYGRLKDAFASIVVASVMATGKYRTNSLSARESLLKVMKWDSTNALIRRALCSVHHELAMAEVRKGNWKLAREFVLQGLGYSPSNEELKSDLDLLARESPRRK